MRWNTNNEIDKIIKFCFKLNKFDSAELFSLSAAGAISTWCLFVIVFVTVIEQGGGDVVFGVLASIKFS